MLEKAWFSKLLAPFGSYTFVLAGVASCTGEMYSPDLGSNASGKALFSPAMPVASPVTTDVSSDANFIPLLTSFWQPPLHYYRLSFLILLLIIKPRFFLGMEAVCFWVILFLGH